MILWFMLEVNNLRKKLGKRARSYRQTYISTTSNSLNQNVIAPRLSLTETATTPFE